MTKSLKIAWIYLTFQNMEREGGREWECTLIYDLRYFEDVKVQGYLG